MSYPELNRELLEKSLAQIEAHPESWFQGQFAQKTDCGTSYCIGGWALVLSFGEPEFVKNVSNWQSLWGKASEALGLTFSEALSLFHGNNTLEQLQEAVQSLLAKGYVRDTLYNPHVEEESEEEDEEEHFCNCEDCYSW